MAVREIKTKLTIDSEKQFNREIQEAGRNMRVMASEMKAAAADFNLTGNEMDYLTRKSDALNSQIKQQETIIEALKDAVASSAKAWGDASAKTDGYRIKLANAEASMAKLKKELQETNAEMDEMGRDSTRVGRQLENGIGEAADDVSRKFDGMVGSLSSDVSSLSKTLDFSVGFDVGKTIVSGAMEAGQAIMNLVDSSMDYNRQMSFLEVNAKQAGYDFEKIKNYAIGVAAITGDMDAAVEGMSMLLQAGFEGDELATVINRLSGAIIQMPDGMKFENLAESLLESVKSGSAVGQYAEYLTKMGIDIETVNKALEEAKKTGQEAAETSAIAFLSGHNAEEALAQWKSDNADVVEYFTSLANLTSAQADLAKELTPAATAMVELATELIEKGTGMIGAGKELYQAWKTENAERQKEQQEQTEQIETETGLYTKLDEVNRKIAEFDQKGLSQSVEMNDLLKERTELIKQIGEAGAELSGANAANEAAAARAEQEAEALRKKVYAPFESAGRSLIGDHWYEKIFDQEKTEEAGRDAAGSVTDGLEGRFLEKMPIAGKDAMTGLANGVNEYGFLVLDANAALVDSAVAEWARLGAEQSRWLSIAPTTPLYGPIQQNTSTQIGTVGVGRSQVVLSVDSREIARTTSGATSAAMGLRAEREETYGP